MGVLRKFNSVLLVAILFNSYFALAGLSDGGISSTNAPVQAETLRPLDETLAPEVLANILRFVGPNDQARASTVSRSFRDGVNTANRIETVNTFRKIDKRFVKFKAPANADGTPGNDFEVLPAVTRADWEGMMNRLPRQFPKNGQGNWNWESCRNCPVTHISWVNDPEDSVPEAGETQEFLAALRAESKNQFRGNCTYTVGTFEQWKLVFHGGILGRENAKYTVAKNTNGELIDVSDENADRYIWHKGNSAKTDSGADIQPLYTKEPNAQGWERPSVALLTETPYSNESPELGQLAIGGAWDEDLSESLPENGSAFVNPNGLVGMSIVRVCN